MTLYLTSKSESELGRGIVAVGSTDHRKTILEVKVCYTRHGVELMVQDADFQDRGKGERCYTRLSVNTISVEAATELHRLLGQELEKAR